MKTLGQVAYEMWASLILNPSSPWHALPKAAQDGWESIAQTVVDENMRQKSVAYDEAFGDGS